MKMGRGLECSVMLECGWVNGIWLGESVMYKLCFYVPESHLNEVKIAVFVAGAGVIGNYDQCCWQTKGQGQFRPLSNSNPFIGESTAESLGKLEVVDEFKVEMVCADEFIAVVVDALKQAHPYEEPAFDVWKMDELTS